VRGVAVRQESKEGAADVNEITCWTSVMNWHVKLVLNDFNYGLKGEKK